MHLRKLDQCIACCQHHLLTANPKKKPKRQQIKRVDDDLHDDRVPGRGIKNATSESPTAVPQTPAIREQNNACIPCLPIEKSNVLNIIIVTPLSTALCACVRIRFDKNDGDECKESLTSRAS
jgi:hypothetical protein